MNHQKANEDPNVIIGTLNVFGYLARVLIDLGAILSCISLQFSQMENTYPTPLHQEFGLATHW